MLPRRIASRYAEALFDLAQNRGTTGEWEQALAAMAEVIQGTPELGEVLTHPEIPLKQKESLMQKVCQGKVAPEVLAVLFMLIKRGHDPDMKTLHDIYIEKWDEVRRILPVTVKSAIPLSETQATTLSQVLAKRTGATIQIHQTVDPSLIAGMVVTIGDRVIDASARTTLEQLQTAMSGV